MAITPPLSQGQLSAAISSYNNGGDPAAQEAAAKGAGSPPPTPSTPAPTGSTPSPYYSRTSADTPLDNPAPQSEDQLQASKLNGAQGEINSLNEYYKSLVNEQKVINAKDDRSTAAVSTLTGLAGSTEADMRQQDTSKQGQAALKKITDEGAMKVQGILSKIRSDSATEARQQRLDYNAGVKDSAALSATQKTDATASLATLSKAGHATLDGIKSTLSPAEYQSLISKVGGEAMAKAILFENRAKNSLVGTPTVVGSHVVQYYQTPDGKTISENVPLPPGVDANGIQSVEKTDAGLFIIKKDSTWSKITGSGKIGTETAGTYTPGANPVVDSWAARIQSGSAKITDIPASQAGLRNSVTVALNAQGNQLNGKPTTTELGLAAKTTAQGLLDKFNKGEGTSAVGKSGMLDSFGYGLIPGTARANFVTDFNSLKSQLSLEGVKYLKGQGAVSDSERALLASAVTKLNLSQSEDEFKTTLQGIIDKLNGNASTPPSDNVVTAPDGTQVQITD